MGFGVRGLQRFLTVEWTIYLYLHLYHQLKLFHQRLNDDNFVCHYNHATKSTRGIIVGGFFYVELYPYSGEGLFHVYPRPESELGVGEATGSSMTIHK